MMSVMPLSSSAVPSVELKDLTNRPATNTPNPIGMIALGWSVNGMSRFKKLKKL